MASDSVSVEPRPREAGSRPSDVLLVIAAVAIVLLVTARVVQRPVALQGVEPIRSQMKIEVNSASAGSLTLLPGIGVGLAERIVSHREEHGPFANVESLQNVRGIGPKTIRRVAPYVTFRAATHGADGESP